MDVGQGDATLIRAPNGQVAMIDNGRWTDCDKTVSFVKGIAVDKIDQHFATHYDADHIGCLDDLVDAGIDLDSCKDRGGSKDTEVFDDYVAACHGTRLTPAKGAVFHLGDVSIKVVDLNGAGLNTDEENSLGMVLLVTYGSFTHVFPGDISGAVEDIVGPEVGNVDVCKVTHHGSAFSNTDAWLDAIAPEVCILSVGNNSFGHPTAEALARLHAHGVESLLDERRKWGLTRRA
ncbi:MAG: MBL fold metallo-hydrolase [Dehalococcoidia bacterium]